LPNLRRGQRLNFLFTYMTIVLLYHRYVA